MWSYTRFQKWRQDTHYCNTLRKNRKTKIKNQIIKNQLKTYKIENKKKEDNIVYKSDIEERCEDLTKISQVVKDVN